MSAGRRENDYGWLNTQTLMQFIPVDARRYGVQLSDIFTGKQDRNSEWLSSQFIANGGTPRDARVSTDGKWIAWISDDKEVKLVVLDMQHHHAAERIIQDADTAACVWAPDSRTIYVFIGQRDSTGAYLYRGGKYTRVLKVAAIAPSSAAPEMRLKPDCPLMVVSGLFDAPPTYSPLRSAVGCGKSNVAMIEKLGLELSSDYGVLILDTNEGGRVVSRRRIVPPTTNGFVQQALISPDGKKLAWVILETEIGQLPGTAEASENKQRVFTSNLDGTQPHEIGSTYPTHVKAASDFEWQPGSKSLSFKWDGSVWLSRVP